jgi:Ca2+-transporting ATPase
LQVHEISVQQLLEQLQADPDKGLSGAEAARRLSHYGPNQLQAVRKKSLWQRFGEQFKDLMIIILIAAALISFMVAFYEGADYFEPILILLIVAINAVMGVVQEGKAEQALEALQEISSPQARVIRDERESIIPAAELVPGDIIKVEAGDYIPADARIIEESSLKVEEAVLTGESVPSEKDAQAQVDANAPLGDRFNMFYAGCSVSYGTAKAVVTATGMMTEMGKIAHLLESEREVATPLQQKLHHLGKYLGLLALGVCLIIFIIGLVSGMKLMEIFMIAVALAVSAIPEGLPAIVTIVLAMGVQRMARRNAIVRKLSAVETLGSASVICSDKTGTLTKNQMTLVKVYAEDAELVEDIHSNNSPAIRKVLQYATLCSEGTVELEGNREIHIGDPTETSIVSAALKNGLVRDELNLKFPRLAQLPFDSDRKLMTTVNDIDGKMLVIVKGAFDVLAARCTAGDLEAARKYNDEFSQRALRVLGLAYKEISLLPPEPNSQTLENDLSFLGLLAMIDPPRPEAQEAVSICRQAGIKPVMITGDQLLTASAIARELGILLPGEQAITGRELASLTQEELDERVKDISVYARVAPEDKIRIVRAWQQKGEVVSMTGDGVNDAPALKAADIGCAMGITGTDVARGASDMVLTDDNFATIVDAVREGRSIYDNIKRTVGFLLGTNIGEVLTVFMAMIFWQVSPFLAVQLLWINLITDSLPAVALGLEPGADDIMERKPRPRNESIFAQGMGWRILRLGALFALITLSGFFLVWQDSGDIKAGRTMAFLVLALSQIFHAFNMRSDHSLFTIGFFTNKYLNRAALISISLIILILSIPSATAAFGMVRLSAGWYLLAVGLALLPVVLMELAKALGSLKPQNAGQGL